MHDRLLPAARHPRVLGVLLVLASASGALADPSGGVAAELGSLEERLDQLERRYLAPALLEQRHQLTARVSDGQLFYLQQDYDRAAMVLLDVVESPAARNHPAYKDALFYLADSLYRTRNYKAAAEYFEQVAAQGGTTQRQQAVGRLLEIALTTHDLAAAERYLQQANALLGTSPDASLLYALGKYHFRNGDPQAAMNLFGRVAPGEATYLRARYYMGVAEVQQSRFDAALALFREVAGSAGARGEGTGREDRVVVDQAHLAIARIHYERGQFAEAVAAYAAVPRESRVFDEALYESVWISIKEADYEKALRKLEVQLISQPDVLRGPDARLLQGKLLMMLGRYDDAAQAFQEVLFEFGPLHDEMRGVVEQNRGNLEAHFNRLIGKNLEEFDLTSFLPERAAEFAGPDADADRALTLVGDLAAQKRDVDDARRTIARLQVALDSASRIEIFPRLHEGWLLAVEARARLVALRAQLNDAAAAALSRPWPSEYQRLHDERRSWATRYRETPRTVVDLQARDARIDDEMSRLQRDAFNLGLEVSGVEAQLAAIRKYVRDTSKVEGPTQKDEAAENQVRAELDHARELRQEVQALEALLDAERIQVGVNDYAAGEDDRIRTRYLAALEAEARWLAANGSSTAGERQRIIALDERITSFLRRATTLVDERVGEIKRQLDRERVNVGSYDGALIAYRGETESLGGAIAARSFKHVLARIDEVVLEADIGLVDVAWKQKEDKSQQISDLLERRRADLEVLDKSFVEVTGE